MPRRGRHRTTLPIRLIAIIAALFVTGGIAVAAGQAAAKSDSDSGGSGLLRSLSGSSKNDKKDSDGDSGSGKSSKSSKDSKNSDSSKNSKDSGTSSGKDAKNVKNGKDDQSDEGQKPDEAQKSKEDRRKLIDFAGRDKIKPAGPESYVDITDVKPNGNIGQGGVFGGGSYTVDCGVGDHTNSDNYMAAPGKRNGAQHTHDYVGNKTTNAKTKSGALDGDPTSCTNGEPSVFFWPVVRDLNGVGPDVGKDGGSLDGNVGRILKARSAEITFNGHPGQRSQPIPRGLMMIMGNAKAKTQDGDNANAKYTCTGFTNRVTDKYPICPAGSKLQRFLDFPSCWDGKNLQSKDFRQHITYPDASGRCGSDSVPLPQLRITLTYDQPAGRAFSLDSFPDNQHDPSTDHSDYENASRPGQSEAGAACINSGRRCKQ